MNIVILSRSPKCYSTKRLKETAQKRGHTVHVMDTLKFTILVEKGKPQLFYVDKPARHCDAVIPRIGASITFFGTAVVRHFEQMGVFTLNTSRSITVSRDKLRASQVLSRHSIGMPTTAFVRDREAIAPAIKYVGGAPVIVKLLEGTQGVGVILADTNKSAQTIVETLQSTQHNVLIQKFVRESKGRDIRTIVVGGKVVAAMRRVAVGGEFRSNVHLGGKVERVILPPEYEDTAIHAAQIMGLRVAGVDMLESKSGPQVMEINSSPGLEGIEAASGVDVANAMIKHLEELVMFPDVDVRQRLTLNAGYAVAELKITDKSDLVNKTIEQTKLRTRDVLVLSILRESTAIPNPNKDRKILVGDTLVCYGKMETLRTLIPTPEEKIKKQKSIPKSTMKPKTKVKIKVKPKSSPKTGIKPKKKKT